MDAGQVETRWYLRGAFSPADAEAVLGEAQPIGEGAVLTAPMGAARAKEAAEKAAAEIIDDSETEEAKA